MQQTAALFDQLVGTGGQVPRHLNPERPRSLEVDNQLKLCRLHHRQVARFRSLEAADVVSSAMRLASPTPT